MSDLKARIGERRRYPADSGVHGHIKKSPANRKPSSSLGHHGHHSKYAASKYKTPFPTGSPSPSHALLQTLDSEPPSLLSRLNPMHADGASSHGDVVSPIDRIVGTKENDQFRELSSMDKPINVETPVEAPRIPVYGNGSFVNIENATSPPRKGSSEQINGGTAPMLPPMTTAQTSHIPPTPTSPEHFLHDILGSTARASTDKDPPPFLGPTDLNAQPGNRLPSPTATIISQIRGILLPLVVQNAQLHPGYGSDTTHPEKIRDKAKDILTNEVCESFVGKMQSIERQMQAHQTSGYPTQGNHRKSRFSAAVEKVATPDGIVSTPSLVGPHSNFGNLPVPSPSMLPSSSIAGNGNPSSLPTPPVSAPLPNAPTAPKAMRIHDFIYGSSQQTTPPPRPLSRKGKEKASHDLNQSVNNLPPRPQSHIDDDILRSQKPPRGDLDVHSTPLQSPGSLGIANPINSGFFESSMKGRARGDSVSTYYPSGRRSSSTTSRPFSPPSSSRFSHSSRHRLSRSPDGYHPRVPRSSHYNDHSRRFSHRPRSRSRSPVHSVPYGSPLTLHGRELDRSPSPKNPSRTPARNGTRRRSSYDSGSRSRSRPRHRISRSPKLSRPSHLPEERHPRRSHRSKSRTRSRSRLRSVPRSTKSIPRHSDRDSIQFDRTRESSLLLTKNHEPPRSSHRSRSRSRSTRRSIQSSRREEYSTDDIFYGPSRPPQTGKAISVPPPPRIKRSLAEVMVPCRNVPGLWFIKMGEEDVRILECEIYIDRETSLKWNLFEKSQPDQGNLFHAQPRPYPLLLKLLCIPTQAIRSTYETSNLGTATPEEIATKLFDLEHEWPRKGTLVVTVNPHKTWGKTWLPIDLEPNSPALDLTACICEGTNVVRFIQLADMAEKVFVLCAMPPAAQGTDDETFLNLPKHLAMSPGPLRLRPAVVVVA